MRYVILYLWVLMLSSCATQEQQDPNLPPMQTSAYDASTYAARMPQHITAANGEKTVVVDPNVHAWGAYDKQGNLVRGGIATAGAPQCDDSDASCHTGTGTFRIHSLGSEECYSHIYPRPEGGGLMPYCMYFNGGQALHGSPDMAVVEANISHGCVRMRIPDAEWLRTQFAGVGTKVIVEAY
jgi:lipoprotein-anchoring transpeptidase ErfK/SrfK